MTAVPADFPALPRRGPAPAVDRMSNAELARMVEAEHPYRGKALFELSDRIALDNDAATKVAMLTRLTSLRRARLFDRVSLAWSGIIALLAAETEHSRAAAYEAFGALDVAEQQDMLDYLEVSSIEEAHPRIA
ncbi:hypothetical protein [Paractinoplanes brasiliensis]|uniref:Uncharacterized protein n=1 Tax=Paractinoplanes brasiliensis TaxID=52695 RepID=A0A4R6JPN5_9ACTN|nr:hypothetical protein [Actinoplanes brasiliensis]MDY7085625.1 hypothetical protein [Actinomycetota bacterium]TDO38483.1 hypothetical protein C8E87_2139 [Actinoplanes brasiliensis]GID26743.1 hypothetical protein Abr02nite_17260 [Actinoplanes brasiliensis]